MNKPARPVRSAQSAVNVRDLVTRAACALAGRGLRGADRLARIRLSRRRGAGSRGQDRRRRPDDRHCSTRAPAISTIRPSTKRSTRRRSRSRSIASAIIVGGRMRTLVRNLDRAGRIAAPRGQCAALRRRAVRAGARADERATAPRGQRSRLAGEPRLARARLCRPSLRRSRPTATLETLAAVERDDLPALGARLITRAALAIAVVGAIDEARAARLVDALFADLAGRAAALKVDRGALRRRRRGRGRRSRRAAIDHPLRPSGAAARRPRLHDQRRARPCAGRRHRPLLAPVPRGAREARPRLFGLGLDRRPTDHASYLYGGTTTKNERAARIARRDPRAKSSISPTAA